MANEQIATYLNDHLAGSVAALELLEHLQATYVNTSLGGFFTELRDEVTSDGKELEAIMNRLRIAQSQTRQATAWIAEKISELKLRVDDPSGGDLRLLEALEALSLGIEGKYSMWRALGAAAKDSTWLRVADYDHLASRAQEQRKRVEGVRLETARKVLAPTTRSAQA